MMFTEVASLPFRKIYCESILNTVVQMARYQKSSVWLSKISGQAK